MAVGEVGAVTMATVALNDWGGLRAPLAEARLKNLRCRLKKIPRLELKWWCERAGLESESHFGQVRTADSFSYAELMQIEKTQKMVERMSNRLKTGVVV